MPSNVSLATTCICLSITMQHFQLNKKMTRNSRICGHIETRMMHFNWNKKIERIYSFFSYHLNHAEIVLVAL